ncbi:MAG TPA: glycosyl hydrolase family 28 protein [Chitinophagaceae bacterium]
MKKFLCIIIVCIAMIQAHANDGLITYVTTPGAVKSETYTVFINGKEVFVEKFKDISYARFAFTGKIELEVKVSQNFERYKLSPLSYNIPSQKKGNTISFSLAQPRKLIFQLEGVAEKLFVFADVPEENAPRLKDRNVINLLDFVTDKEGNKIQTKELQKAIDQTSRQKGILYVPNGKYLTGTFVIKKDVTLYLESGALIQGSGNINDYNDNGDNKTGKVTTARGALIYFDKADNAKIMGRGVIAMAGTKIKTETGQKIRICNMRECRNAGIYDVIIRDSGGFTIHILHSSGITMKGYKIINDLSLPNEDGTDPDGCDNVTVDDVFMYTSDDAIAVKADHRLCQNITVKNGVFWTVKSALKVGSDPYFGARNISFINNDVVHADRALALYSGKGPIEDVKFIDNKSEFVGGNAKRQLIVFQVSNSKEDNEDVERRGVGYIKGVQVINYTAYEQSQNKSLISGTIARDGSLHKVSDVLFKNLVIEGKHCLSAEDAKIILAPTELPVDPNVPPKEIEKMKKTISLERPLTATENIRFQ